jgi:tetratricopeptide (TPR) repeat protein
LLLFLLLFVVLYVSRDAIHSELSGRDEADDLLDRADGVIATLQQSSGTDRPLGQRELPDIPRLNDAEKSDTAEQEAAVAEPDSLEPPFPREYTRDNEADPGEQEVGETADAVTGGPDDEVMEETSPPPVIAAVTAEQILNTWQQARIAAWYGDYARAIEHYQTVITLQPDNFDAYGEMGNIMLYAGDRDGAVAAYYQAARLLNETPYRHFAWYLLNVIAGLDPQVAEMLYQELLEQSQP